jgi:Tol biopolymer transport system component
MRRTVLMLVATALGILIVGGMSFVAIEKPAHAAFPGKNGKIVFASNRTTGEVVNNPEGDFEIFTMNPDGTGLQQLTSNAASDLDPAWSADGKQIAFESDRDGSFGIYVMKADGSGQTQLTSLSPDPSTPQYSWDRPAWSPDGTKIAFASGGDIYVINIDGSGLKNLTNSPGSEYGPSWSPDGTKIAFASGIDIYVMDAGGSEPTNLTGGGTDCWASVSTDWSPDGSKIAFQCNISDSEQIWVMNADGSDISQLTFGELPSWSPDGKKIAFFRREVFWDNSAWIYVVNADGSNQTRLTDSPWYSISASWQPLPESKAACKNGDHKEFGFKNQGQCIKAIKANT